MDKTGNYCKRCEVFCFDEEYCEDCKEHITVCEECGEYFDMSNLAAVFAHVHKGLNTNINVKSKRLR